VRVLKPPILREMAQTQRKQRQSVFKENRSLKR